MRLAISMGDPAGIGPEVTLRALAGWPPVDATDRGRSDRQSVQPIIFGSVDAIRRDAGLIERSDDLRARFRPVHGVDDIAPDGEDSIWIVDVAPDVDANHISHGNPHPDAARLQLAAFRAAVDAVVDEHADAVVTAPWTKSLFREIDRAPTGHTELLAERFPDATPTMMLAGPRLRVSLATTHVPLRDAADQITRDGLAGTIRTTIDALRRRFLLDAPDLAICGLNPHAGEAGAIGTEEQRLIEPLLDDLTSELQDDADLHGPFPADTLFTRFRQGDIPFDAVVAMYHDQGLIPLKLLHFGESANITLGLPIIRTSVDHGTAYDIAGEGIADAGSMKYALRTAARMATGHRDRDRRTH